MLYPDFFEIILESKTPGQLDVRVKLNANHAIYTGHFPGKPVTPGVVQIQMVKEILQHSYGQTLEMSQLRQCKFLQIIDPNETPEIDMVILVSGEELKQVNATGSWDGVCFFKLSATYSIKIDQ